FNDESGVSGLATLLDFRLPLRIVYIAEHLCTDTLVEFVRAAGAAVELVPASARKDLSISEHVEQEFALRRVGNSIPCVLGAQNDLRSQQKITSHCGSARSPDILPTISRDVRRRKSSLANVAPNLRSLAKKGLSRGISNRPELSYGTQDA